MILLRWPEIKRQGAGAPLMSASERNGLGGAAGGFALFDGLRTLPRRGVDGTHRTAEGFLEALSLGK